VHLELNYISGEIYIVFFSQQALKQRGVKHEKNEKILKPPPVDVSEVQHLVPNA